MKLILSLTLLFAAVIAWPSRALAEDAREVEGRAAFSKGDYAHALDVFARLYAEDGDPLYLRNIGRCHQKLRQPDEAIDAFRNYLRRGKKIKPAEKREVEGFIAEMQALKTSMKDEAPAADKERARAADATPAPVETRARPAPAPSPADPGIAKEASEPRPVSGIPRAKVAVDERSGTPPPDQGEPAKTGSWHPAAALVGLGLTLIAGGVGAYGILHNHSLVSDFDKTCAIDMNKVPYSTVPSRSDASCVATQGDYQAATRLAIVGFAGAAVLAGATVVIWLTTPSTSESQVSMWSCAPGLTDARGPAFGCRLRF